MADFRVVRSGRARARAGPGVGIRVLVVSMLTAAAVAAACGKPRVEQSSAGRERQGMSLRLAFTEGFAEDAVVAQVGGREVRSSGPIATRRDVEPPLAWSVDVPVDQPVVTVKVSISGKDVAESIQIDVRQFPQLNVSMVGGRLVLRGAPFTPSIG